jgi:NarL family two-component system response regulator LiaR
MVEPIRIVIVDDHNMVRKGLCVLLEDFDDMQVIAEAGDGEAGVDVCRRECPDVVLMDMIMPRMDGVTATEHIREACPETEIIALTSFDTEDNVRKALKAGAIGYLMKNVSGDELANAIRRAHEGQSTLAPAAAQVLISATTRPPAIGHDLTAREREVLALMIEGLNNREIGEQLVISSSTVKNHVSSILGKLNTTSRTQAVALAVEHKILEDVSQEW